MQHAQHTESRLLSLYSNFLFWWEALLCPFSNSPAKSYLTQMLLASLWPEKRLKVCYIFLQVLLRSAVGNTHVLRSDLWWTIPLHSEIDHIHLSSEAQCVSHHLPLVDCHKYYPWRFQKDGAAIEPHIISYLHTCRAFSCVLLAIRCLTPRSRVPSPVEKTYLI